jgi:hypothetical protein
VNECPEVYSVIPEWRDKAEYNFLHEIINQRKRFPYREQPLSPRVSWCKVQQKPKVKKNVFKTRYTERRANKSLNCYCIVFLTEYKKKHLIKQILNTLKYQKSPKLDSEVMRTGADDSRLLSYYAHHAVSAAKYLTGLSKDCNAFKRQ